MAFTNEQLERYSRHIILKEVGVKGQKKLLNAKVLIIGAGGLGSPAALYLAAAGVGTIGIVDADEVDLSNLQRQVIHQIGFTSVNNLEILIRRNCMIGIRKCLHDTMVRDGDRLMTPGFCTFDDIFYIGNTVHVTHFCMTM